METQEAVKRPTDPEVVKLLRELGDDHPLGLGIQAHQMADALEAASAEPFEAKVERAIASFRPNDGADGFSGPEKFREAMANALRAADVR